MPKPEETTSVRGVRCYTLPMTMARIMPKTYQDCEADVTVGLTMLSDVDFSVMYRANVTGTSRVLLGLRKIGRVALAKQIEEEFAETDRPLVSVDNPFIKDPPVLGEVQLSPLYARIRHAWQVQAPDVRAMAPKVPPVEVLDVFAAQVEAARADDAYHSLSIERYQVTPELISKVASGNWNPKESPEDQKTRDALAAKGYLEAFEVVKGDAVEAFSHAGDVNFDTGDLFRKRHRIWFSRLFSPSVNAGLIPAAAVEGYRNHMVYLSGSMHCPPPHEIVKDGMTALIDCFREEKCAFTRAVLGHWLFGYIHPYMDGNGRMARFTMNVMLASGGYPWTIIRVEDRERYMAALEEASVNGNVTAFAGFIASCIPS